MRQIQGPSRLKGNGSVARLRRGSRVQKNYCVADTSSSDEDDAHVRKINSKRKSLAESSSDQKKRRQRNEDSSGDETVGIVSLEPNRKSRSSLFKHNLYHKLSNRLEMYYHLLLIQSGELLIRPQQMTFLHPK